MGFKARANRDEKEILAGKALGPSDYVTRPFAEVPGLVALQEALGDKPEEVAEALEPNLDIRDDSRFCVFEGDLVVEGDFDASGLESEHEVCVVGDVRVKGMLLNQLNTGLFVMGNLRAQNIYLGECFTYVGEDLTADNVLHPEHSGETVVEGAIRAKTLVYLDDNHGLYCLGKYIHEVPHEERHVGHFIEDLEALKAELRDGDYFNSNALRKALQDAPAYDCVRK